MTIVFLSGSRALSRINDAIRARLNNMIDSELEIVVGDANGADKAMQTYLAERKYNKVTIYCVGAQCRNNVGDWTVHLVNADPKLSGWEFYAQKDKEMARLAEFGFVLWDGKSAGSIHNVFELLRSQKKVVVYYGPEKQFFNISNTRDALELLRKGDPSTIDGIMRKIRLSNYLKHQNSDAQADFTFH